MIDLSVKDLVKSFDADTNLLDGVSFDIQAGERVGLLGRNGAGKTTLFKILTGELDYNTGEVRFAPGRKVGLISQIPHYPAGYTVEDVLRTAFRELANIQSKMRRLEEQMAAQPDKALLAEYDALSTRFQTGGGYETDMQTDKICNGLGIPAAQRQQDFDSLSGGEKTRVNLARLLLEKTDILLLDEPTNHLDMHAVEWLEGAPLLPYRSGVFKIAQKANVPIVVCSLVNSRAILHNMFRKHTEVWLDVLDVVPAEELAGKTAIEVGERVHAVMEAGIVARETEQGLRA